MIWNTNIFLILNIYTITVLKTFSKTHKYFQAKTSNIVKEYVHSIVYNPLNYTVM